MTTEIQTSPELLYLLSGDAAELAETVATMRVADIAEALNDLAPVISARVLAAMPFDVAVQVADQPELDGRADIFGELDTDTAAALIEAMSADEQADLFGEMAESERRRLTAALDPATRAALRMLLRYPEHTAGGIMTTELVSVRPTATVQEVLDHLEEVGPSKETIYAIYVVDTDGRLLNVVSLRELIQADPAAAVGVVADRRKPLSVDPMTDREEVARQISKYNLLAMPVVDEGGRILGIVTVDDVIDVLVTELTEDVQKFGGMEALDESYTEIGFFSMVRKRAGWLSALFLSEMLTATAMGHFEGEISKAVVLALFIPLIISSGGNSGSQATSLIIRAMALREVTLRDWWRVAGREIRAGLALGVVLGIIGFLRISVWQSLGWYDYGTHHVLVALTVATALVGIVTWGSLAGSMLPFIMRALGFDPASASAPFVATLVDVTGIIIYFNVALVIMRGTLL